MTKLPCPCPYVPCAFHGNCTACVTKSRTEGTLTNCMEEIAVSLGAELPKNPPATMVCANSEEVAHASAREIVSTISKNPEALLCFPAGSSALRTYQILKELHDGGHVDFSKAHFVQLDEWLGLRDESENCTAFLQRSFYSPLGIREDQIKLFDIHATDMNAACVEMDCYLEQNGPIDFMLLGLGMNGHLALNEPGISWNCGATTVELSSTTSTVGQKYFSHEANLTRGVTLGIKHIFAAHRVVLQVSGAAKSEIVAQMYHSRVSEDLPCTVLKVLSNALVILDQPAASQLECGQI